MTASATAAYLWEDPGKSIRVHVSLDVVQRLGVAVHRGLGAGGRGSEIGGVLLGRTAPDGRTVLVEDFSSVPCEHLRGASYILSPKERHALGARLERRRLDQVVVGYFRSHTRRGLYLDQDDFAIISSYFPDPSQVFLVVRPDADGSAVGGFFFWEDGEINRRSPYRQFPFDRQRLLAGDFPITDAPAPRPAAAPRRAPAPVTQTAPRTLRGAPQVPWPAVPVIAGLSFIAGLFVSPHRASQPAPVPQKASAPGAVAEGAQNSAFTPQTSEAARPQSPKVAEGTQNTAALQPTPRAEPPHAPVPRRAIAKRVRRNNLYVPAPATAARIAPPEVAPPPTLIAPVREQMELAAALAPRTANRPPPPEAEVSYTAPHPSAFRHVLHQMTHLSEEAPTDAFVPPSPIRKVSPTVPPGTTAAERSVDVKVYIDESGNVSRAQLLTKRSGQADSSLSAARQWQFAPARKRDKPIASEMVLHFRFAPSR